MLDSVVRMLACPHCGSALTGHGPALRCAAGHSFDLARQGYVNLGGNGPVAGDSAAMVDARDRFLGLGHYRPIVDAVVAAAGGSPGPLLDVGAGTGHYLAAVLDAAPDAVGLALDVSKHAARRAARAHARAGAAVCDVWRTLPVRDGAVSTALTVFAPRNPAELRRVLRPGGTLVVVTPQADHLAELVTALGLLRVEPDKLARLDAAMSAFDLLDRIGCRFTMTLTPTDVRAVVGMGPSAWHRDGDDVAPTGPVLVGGAVTVSRYRSR